MSVPPLIELQYLPPSATMALWAEHEKVIIEQHENYQKGSYRNRTLIAGANGAQRLSIPLVSGKNQQMPIREVRIDSSQSWQTHHWRSIRSAYGSAPFFAWYADKLRPVYEKSYQFLFDVNLELLHILLSAMQNSGDIALSDAFVSPGSYPNDWRNRIKPGKSPSGFDLHYNQVFEARHGFIPGLSVIDLLFCTGPEATSHLSAASNTAS